MARWLALPAGLALAAALIIMGRSLVTESQPDGQLVRYGNVIFALPGEDLGISTQYIPALRADRPAVIQFSVPTSTDDDDEDEPTLRVSPDDGAILSDTLSSVTPDVAKQILSSMRVVDEDSREGWPYDASGKHERGAGAGRFQYAAPDPVSGILVYRTFALCRVAGCPSETLTFTNGRSRLTINADTGESIESSLDEGDREAFERLRASIVSGDTPEL